MSPVLFLLVFKYRCVVLGNIEEWIIFVGPVTPSDKSKYYNLFQILDRYFAANTRIIQLRICPQKFYQ